MELPKEFSLNEIAAVCGGKVGGDGAAKVKRVALSPLQAGAGDLALFFDAKLLSKLAECRATAVVIPEGTTCDVPHIAVRRPQLALQRMLSALQPKRFVPEKGVHPTACVDPTAQLAADVAVGPLACIGPHTKIGARTVIGAGAKIGGMVVIGDDCFFHQGCMVADYVKIGNRVVLQQGASVGADGFGYVTERPSNWELRQDGAPITELSDAPNPLLKIPQIGTVVLEDDVEVGSNACIDRATMGATVVGAGTKIDNLVMIAHNNRIGKECIIVAGTCLAGSCTVGDRAVMAGQVGIKDHTRIGKDAILLAQCGVIGDVGEGEVLVGSPGIPVKDTWIQIAHTKKLPSYAKELKDMRKRVEQLEKLLVERQLETSKK